ncbi:endolytic transglycosylase MltG [Candidatus Parcubacteria bacterium]|nr:MAG: endolytic transglycosylase MltG [Candidatus Parcubacteria bacterium]
MDAVSEIFREMFFSPRIWKKAVLSLGLLLLVAAILFNLYLLFLFSAPQKSAPVEEFTVPRGASVAEVSQLLWRNGIIRSPWAFAVALGGKTIRAGGYYLSKAMNAWEVAATLAGDPFFLWVVVPEGLRKEEIADIFAEKLGWSEEERRAFLSAPEGEEGILNDGMYFPDTYLVPKDVKGKEMAQRMFRHFNEVFSPLAKEFLQKNIKWDTALTLASLVQREASRRDMALVAGILWNRLLRGMRLEVDATVQYARGKTKKGWWAPITKEDKQIDSPYNTYLHYGLPPAPIANPGRRAIEAVLRPAATKCLYYLHRDSRIYCAETYEEHLRNIRRVLR